MKVHELPKTLGFSTNELFNHVFPSGFGHQILLSTFDKYSFCKKSYKWNWFGNPNDFKFIGKQNILIKKTGSPSIQVRIEILFLTRKSGRIASICQIQQYAPYLIKLKELIETIAQYFEPIGCLYMSHSYVRGN